MATIYILRHPKSGFTGYVLGVGFDNGRGSTNSKTDADNCIAKGCKDITGGEKPDEAKKESKQEKTKKTKSKVKEKK